MNQPTNNDDDVQITLKTEPRDYRKELWIGVAVAVARAENTKESDKPAKWANNALDEFDKRFGVK